MACPESVVKVIHSDHAYYDHICINENTGNFYSRLFLYRHSIFECLCSAGIAKSDVSLDTLSIYIL